MKILITGGRSIQALKLVKSFASDAVILADYGEMPSFPSKQYHFVSLGERRDDVIAHTLLTCCLDEGADAVLPLNGFEIDEIAKSIVLFEEFNIQILMPEQHQIMP